MFDARQYRESLERPTFVDVDAEGNEVTFTGDLVTFNTVVPFLDRFAAVNEMTTEGELQTLIADFIQAINMSADVLPYLFALPISGQLEAVTSFFLSIRQPKKRE